MGDTAEQGQFRLGAVFAGNFDGGYLGMRRGLDARSRPKNTRSPEVFEARKGGLKLASIRVARYSEQLWEHLRPISVIFGT